MNLNKRNISLDILRILACIAVIVIHTAGSPIYHKMVEPGTLWFSQCLTMDALCRWSVPIFVMLSGFFMIDPTKEISIKNLFTKYTLRIVLSLVFWSVFYAITLHKEILPFGTQEGHFWFLGMLIGVYISLPILRLIASNKFVLKYFCIVWAVFLTYKFIGNFCKLPLNIDSMVFVEYAGYALMGYLLKTVDLSRKARYIVYGLGLVGLGISLYMVLKTQDEYCCFMQYAAPNTIVLSVAIFLFAIQHPIQLPQKYAFLIQTVSECTFGIYLIHMWLLIQSFFRIHRYIEAPIPLCILCVGFAFVGGLLITLVLKRIPFINKYIV